MLVLSMNSKRQRRPNVRLWEVGDLPAAFTCGVSQRNLGPKTWKYGSDRNNELGNSSFGFFDFGISPEMPADMRDDTENENPNPLELVREDDICGQDDELNASKSAISFGCVMRKCRVMKRRRRSPVSLFLDPWGSKYLCTINKDDFVLSSGFNEFPGPEIETSDPNFGMQMVQSSNEHCDDEEEAETVQERSINSVGEWLEGIGFGKYIELFKLHEVDKETLPLLTLDDLKEMGICRVGNRRKLFNAITRLRDGNASYISP